MERKQLHILPTSYFLLTAACHMRSCHTHTHSPSILGELRFSCAFCALFLDADKRNNYVKNYMALLTPETMPRFLCLSATSMSFPCCALICRFICREVVQ